MTLKREPNEWAELRVIIFPSPALSEQCSYLWVCFHFSLALPNETRDVPRCRMREEINEQEIKYMSSFILMRSPPFLLLAFLHLWETLAWLSLAAGSPHAVGCSWVRVDRGLCKDYFLPGAALNKEQLNRTWQNTKDDMVSFREMGVSVISSKIEGRLRTIPRGSHPSLGACGKE